MIVLYILKSSVVFFVFLLTEYENGRSWVLLVLYSFSKIIILAVTCKSRDVTRGAYCLTQLYRSSHNLPSLWSKKKRSKTQAALLWCHLWSQTDIIKAKHDATKTSSTFFKRTRETSCISRVSSVCYGRAAWCQHSTQPWSLFSIDSQLNAQQYGFSFGLQIAQTLVTHCTICAPRTRAHI